MEFAVEVVGKLLWLLKPEGIGWLIQTGGVPAICLVIFAETGFFAILPGDSMLVLCGIIAATPAADGRPLLNLPLLLTAAPLCGVAGDQVGFWLGSFVGKPMYQWKDRYIWRIPLFKQAYLRRTEEFYARWGSFTIVAGRWVPFVRTFAPIIAGIIKMRFITFITFNVIGAFTWVWSMVLAGYYLPRVLEPVVQKFWPSFTLATHIDKVALVVVLLSTIPLIHTVWKESRRSQTNNSK